MLQGYTVPLSRGGSRTWRRSRPGTMPGWWSARSSGPTPPPRRPPCPMGGPAGRGEDPKNPSHLLASPGTVSSMFPLWGAQGFRAAAPAVPTLRVGSSMACRISELVLGCRDPEVLARFWCEVLDFVVLDREEDGSLEIGPREGFGGPQPTIILSRRDEPERGKSRLHIDINATDRDQDAELERLLKLGARPADIGQTGEESWHVLADPEGNEFCLLKARLNPL